MSDWDVVISGLEPEKAQPSRPAMPLPMADPDIFTDEPWPPPPPVSRQADQRVVIDRDEWAGFQRYQAEQQSAKRAELERRQNTKPRSHSKILWLAGSTVVTTLLAQFGLEGVVPPEAKDVIVSGLVTAGGSAIAVARIWFTTKFLS